MVREEEGERMVELYVTLRNCESMTKKKSSEILADEKRQSFGEKSCAKM